MTQSVLRLMRQSGIIAGVNAPPRNNQAFPLETETYLLLQLKSKAQTRGAEESSPGPTPRAAATAHAAGACNEARLPPPTQQGTTSATTGNKDDPEGMVMIPYSNRNRNGTEWVTTIIITVEYLSLRSERLLRATGRATAGYATEGKGHRQVALSSNFHRRGIMSRRLFKRKAIERERGEQGNNRDNNCLLL